MNTAVNPETLVRPSILNLKPYESQAVPGCIRLDANENPFPWPKEMREALFQESLTLNRYPDGSAQELKEAISLYTGVPSTGILVGNGSDELIQLLLSVFGGTGKAVLIHPPTFSMYKAAATVTGTKVLEVPLINGVTLDVAGMLEVARSPEVSVIIICSPNNPTGSLFAREEILRIVRESGKIVLVDEAYAEFSGESLKGEIPEFPSLLVMRTFSKAFALAGLRLGYILGQAQTISLINRARQPFNVNMFTQKAGIYALRYLDSYKVQVEILKNETAKIYETLKEISGVKVYPTRANFVLFQPQDPDIWYQELIKRGFQVRHMGELPVLGKALRVSAGLPEENEAFLQAIKEIAGFAK